MFSDILSFRGKKNHPTDGKKKENLSIPKQFNKSEDILVFSFRKKREATAGPHKEASSGPHLVSLRSSQAAKGQPTSPGMKSVGKSFALPGQNQHTTETGQPSYPQPRIPVWHRAILTP